MVDKSKYICNVPFKYTEVYDHKQYLCCPSWLNVDISDGKGVQSSFYSQKAIEVRNSIIDGSYKFCDELQCPYLNGLLNGKGDQGMFLYKEAISIEKLDEMTFIKTLNMCFDRSCNLQCPSCRVELVNYLGKDRESVEIKLTELTEEIGKKIRRLYLSGTADPFYSKSFRQFLINFDKTKFPVLRSIHLHTNAQLWTEQLWSKMHNIHKYVNSCEISIDAATKDTYENKVRLGGSWDTLIKNLEFIKTIPSLSIVSTSFVVQKANYKEVELFYKIITEIFKGTDKKIVIFFNKITNWGTYTDEEFLIQDVSNPEHPEHKYFIEIFKKVHNLPKVTHNITVPVFKPITPSII